MREVVHRLSTNTTPFYIRDLSTCKLWCPRKGGPRTNSPQIPREGCAHKHVPIVYNKDKITDAMGSDDNKYKWQIIKYNKRIYKLQTIS